MRFQNVCNSYLPLLSFLTRKIICDFCFSLLLGLILTLMLTNNWNLKQRCCSAFRRTLPADSNSTWSSRRARPAENRMQILIACFIYYNRLYNCLSYNPPTHNPQSHHCPQVHTYRCKWSFWPLLFPCWSQYTSTDYNSEVLIFGVAERTLNAFQWDFPSAPIHNILTYCEVLDVCIWCFSKG